MCPKILHSQKLQNNLVSISSALSPVDSASLRKPLFWLLYTLINATQILRVVITYSRDWTTKHCCLQRKGESWKTTVTNHQVPLTAGDFLSGWGNISFPRRTLLHGDSRIHIKKKTPTGDFHEWQGTNKTTGFFLVTITNSFLSNRMTVQAKISDML